MITSRLWLFTRAMAGLDSLNQKAMSLIDQPKDLIKLIFAYSGSFLKPVQVEEEIAKLVEEAKALNPKVILEIGTSMGGTLYLWTRIANPDALIISVDLRGGKFGGGYSMLRTPLYRRFARERQRLVLIRANSHDESTLKQVKSLIGRNAVDFLFIDGDHTYDGVKQDWEMYSQLVRPGGLVAFHDIATNYADTQAKQHWDKIKEGYVHREYMEHPQGLYGIGVLVKN